MITVERVYTTTERDFFLRVDNGPSKQDLLTSLATAMAKAPNQPFKVIFEIEAGQELPNGRISTAGYKCQAVITGMMHEDGSGESFCIDGSLHDNYNGRLRIAMNYRFKGYFHTRSRSGYLQFTANN